MTIEEAVAHLRERVPGMARMAEEYRSPEGQRTTEATATLVLFVERHLAAGKAAHEKVEFKAASNVDTGR